QPLGAVLGEVMHHRGIVHAMLSGDASRQFAATESAAQVDRLMTAVDAADAEADAVFATSKQWREIKEEWARLRSQSDALTAQENADRHGRLINRILELNMKVWMDSTLSLDPEATAYYLIIAATDKTPDVLDHIENMRMLGTSAALAGALSPADARAMAMYRKLIQQDLSTMDREISSVAADADVRDTILPALQNAAGLFAEFDSYLTQHVPTSGAITASGAQIYDSGTRLSDSLLSFRSNASGAVMRQLEQRLDRQTSSRSVNVMALAALLAFALVLSVLITRRMAGSMAHAISVFGSISTGRYDNVIEQEGTDEAAQVLGALEQMQSKLAALKQEEASTAATVGGRIRAALDHAASSMLVTDSSLNVIYTNHTFDSLMRAVETDIRRVLPRFSLDTLL